MNILEQFFPNLSYTQIMMPVFNMDNFIIPFLIVVLFIGILVVLYEKDDTEIKFLSFFFSSITFFLSLFIWYNFNKNYGFQFEGVIPWLPQYNINIVYGIDGISLYFLLLSTFLIPICILSAFDAINKNVKGFYLCFLVLEIFLIISFSVLDLFFFYLAFEAILIPMFLLIGIWGSRNRKIFASYYFFFYTLAGSLLMLLAIMYIFYSKGTTDLLALINYTEFNAFEQKILFLGFFMSFASKIPLFPFHIWLPEAHVEAPTAGSVLLAGVLLKLGSYGYLRFCCTLFPYANHYYKEIIAMLALIGIVNTSLTAIRQTDMKRVVAYASVAHMNLIMLGVFFFSIEGVEGAILQMISHGLVSSGLFLCIGVLYDRFHSKVIEYYGGVAAVMPNFVLAFGILIFANIAFPGTSSFVGELLILAGIFLNNSVVALIGGLGVILGGTYSLYLFNRAAFGNFKSTYLHLYEDLTLVETIILFILVFLVILVGIFPSILLEDLHKSIYELEIIYNLGMIKAII